MTNIDFNERVDTYTNQVQDILTEYFGDSTGLNIRGAALEIALLYVQRENELLKAILESTKKSFGLKEE